MSTDLAATRCCSALKQLALQDQRWALSLVGDDMFGDDGVAGALFDRQLGRADVVAPAADGRSVPDREAGECASDDWAAQVKIEELHQLHPLELISATLR